MALNFLKDSLKAKVAAFFVAFGLLFAIEGTLVIIFWIKAGAVSKQIEVVLEAEQINQEAQITYKEFLVEGQKSLPKDLVGQFERVHDLLTTLLLGGRAGTSDLILPPASGLSVTSVKKLTQLQEEEKQRWTNLLANKIQSEDQPLIQANDSTALDNPTNEAPNIYERIIEIDGLSSSLNVTFRQLVKDLRTEENDRQSQLFCLISVIVLIDMVVLGYFFALMSRKIFNPLKEIAEAANNQQISTTYASDEIGLVASHLNVIINQLRSASDFIQSIGDGKLDIKVDEKDDSILSAALVSMQQKLKSISEEDQKRNWATEGLAKFVEILRSGESNLSTLGDDIIKALVNYTGSTQGGLYIWNDDQPDNSYLELIASYAYNRKKYEKKIIKAKEGLLGQAYLEKATTYLTEIPHDYFRIISGLGEMDPQAILIVPLLSDNKVYGLVELASIKKFEPYEIAFVEKLGEAVASSLASVKTNEKNKKLLQEFQEQTESMRSQEEEMRQNMEELTATQEEMSRKEGDYVKQIEDLKEKLEQASAEGQWKVAQQAGEALQTNLKALNITLEELRKPN